MSVSGRLKSERSRSPISWAAAGLVCALLAGNAAQAAPVLSVNAAGPCPTQASLAWTVAWLVPPQTVLDPAEAVTAFVRDMLVRVGWINAQAAVHLGCSNGGPTHAEGNHVLVHNEDLGLDELLLSYWAARRAGPAAGDDAGLWGRLGRAGAIATLGSSSGS
jgi:hypothetical protein